MLLEEIFISNEKKIKNIPIEKFPIIEDFAINSLGLFLWKKGEGDFLGYNKSSELGQQELEKLIEFILNEIL